MKGLLCLLLIVIVSCSQASGHRRTEIVENAKNCVLPSATLLEGLLGQPGHKKRGGINLQDGESLPGSIPLEASINDQMKGLVDGDHVWYLQVRSLFSTSTIPTPDDGLCGWHALYRMMTGGSGPANRWFGLKLINAFLAVLERNPRLYQEPCVPAYSREYVIGRLSEFLRQRTKSELWLEDSHLDVLALVMRRRITIVRAPESAAAELAPLLEYPSPGLDVNLQEEDGAKIDPLSWPSITLLNYGGRHYEPFSDEEIGWVADPAVRQTRWNGMLNTWRAAKMARGFLPTGLPAGARSCGSDFNYKCAYGLLCCPVSPQEAEHGDSQPQPQTICQDIESCASQPSTSFGPMEFTDSTIGNDCRGRKHVCGECCCALPYEYGGSQVCQSASLCINIYTGRCI